MAAARVGPLNSGQCFLSIRSSIQEWQSSLATIANSIREWRELHKDITDTNLPRQGAEGIEPTSTSVLSGQTPEHTTTAQRRTGSEQSSGSPEPPPRIPVMFDAHSQKALEQLTNSFQTARILLHRCLNSRTPESRRLDKARQLMPFASSSPSASPTQGPVQPPEDSRIRIAMSQIRELIGKAQDQCEDAAHQLLRRGSCSMELAKTEQLLLLCSEEVEEAVDHYGKRREEEKEEQPKHSAGVSVVLSSSASRGPAFPSHTALEADDDDDDDPQDPFHE